MGSDPVFDQVLANAKAAEQAARQGGLAINVPPPGAVRVMIRFVDVHADAVATGPTVAFFCHRGEEWGSFGKTRIMAGYSLLRQRQDAPDSWEPVCGARIVSLQGTGQGEPMVSDLVTRGDGATVTIQAPPMQKGTKFRVEANLPESVARGDLLRLVAHTQQFDEV